MRLKSLAILLFLGVVSAPLEVYASRVEPIYNVVNHPIPASAQKLPLDVIAKAIIAGGARTQWQIAPGSGGLVGVLNVRDKHQANVAITYSQTSFNITLVSSSNLLQEGNLIHRNYNRWVRELERNIADQLAFAGPGAQ